MTAAFDDSAASYDEDFTNTSIGRLQRNKVWEYLEKTFSNSFPKKILELNCGTGEDAIFFAEHGCEVLATDVSEQMLAVTKNKTEQRNPFGSVITAKLDMNEFEPADFENNYELVFSNFGGLNCVNPHQLELLLNKIAKILVPHGRIILVVMPKFCLWETFYFTSKFKFKKAFRRQRSQAQKAALTNGEVNVWYHSPVFFRSLTAKYCTIKNIQPIGISLPPSYLQTTFLARNSILKKLDSLERRLSKYPSLAGFADHYLIDLELR
jgi:ubiquinone/menaquinone biosynthesis C-methylase UbiE